MSSGGVVLVTGATGFVGSRVVRRAVAQGLPVRALSRRRASLAGAEVAVGDVTEPSTLPAALDGVGTVIHAAAITGNHKERARGEYDRVNRIGTANVVAAASGAGARRIVLLSGLGVVPAPPGTYMATRWGMEETVRGSGLEYVVLQPSVLFGGEAEFVTALVKLIRRSPIVPVIGPSTLRFQPLWVEDLVTCLLLCTGPDAPLGRTLPLGGPEWLTFRDIIGALCAALGKRRLMVPLPARLAQAQATAMSAILANPPLTPAAVELLGFDNATDLDAVERHFGFRPRGFRSYLAEEGVTG